ncbi:MAG: prenyltransferase [Actinomycetota bacterium]
MSLLSVLFHSSRPLSWINTAYPFVAGYLMSTGHIDLTLVIGTAFFLVPYNIAMYGINDVFDYESDIRNPRKGGVEGAVVKPQFHRPILWASALTCLPFVVYLVAVGSTLSNAVLAVSLFAVIAYSVKGLRFKEIPFLDSITSSTHFVSPALFGIVLATGTVDTAQWLILGAFFLWGLASHAFGAVQDIVADRDGGLNSIATVIGGAWTVRFAVACYALAGLLLVQAPGLAPWVSPVALLYIAAIAQWWNVAEDNCEDANRGWKRLLALNFIAGFVVTMALIAYALF